VSAKILVVDDEPNLLRMVAYSFEAEGFRVITAENATAALTKAQTERPDAVLLDVMLPDMSGLDVCRQLRARPDTAHVPIIMLSALVEVADKIRGLEAGADEYIIKPVEPDELVMCVQTLLEHIRQTRPRREDKTRAKTKILVVDDEPNLLRLISYSFAVEGYDVITAERGSDALKKARMEQPDVIVLDVMLPDMNGLEVCRQLRANRETAHLPIMILSIRSEIQDKIRGFKAGADGYLTKPVDSDELVARIEALLERERQRSKPR